MKVVELFVPFLLLFCTTVSGLGNQFLNRFLCGKEPVSCDAQISSGKVLSDLCQDLVLELEQEQASTDLGVVVYFQVQ